MNAKTQPAAALLSDTGPEQAAAEWQRRVELAACYRLIAHYRMTDLVYTHVSVRVPGRLDRFLINPYGLFFEEVTASSLVEIDVEGKPTRPGPYSVNPAGFTIHSAIHMARHDALCVLHTHTKPGMAVAALDCGLLPLNQISMQFHNRLAYHDYEGIALDLDERPRLIQSLGSHWALILRNHGLLTLGRTVGEAFSRMLYLNRACEVQLEAMACGRELVIPSPAVCERAAGQFDQSRDSRLEHDMEWEAQLRLLDRLDDSYRT